jgi:hypothetical protein
MPARLIHLVLAQKRILAVRIKNKRNFNTAVNKWIAMENSSIVDKSS